MSDNVMGYKVHFDGRKFVAEHEKSEVNASYHDSCEWWYTDERSAEDAVEDLNKDTITRVEEDKVYSDSTILVQRCRECGNYFAMNANEIEWYQNKDMSVPKRCYRCRKARKKDETATSFKVLRS
jgi:hypothetical protein